MRDEAMKIIANQRGYTLVTVLLIMVLFFSIGAVLLAHNLNSATQVRVTEARHQVIALAEKGIEFAEASIRSFDEEEIEQIVTEIQKEENFNLSEEELRSRIAQRIAGNITGERILSNGSFSVEVVGTSREENIIFYVTSVGSSDRDFKITAEIKVSATFSDSGGGHDSTGDFADPENFYTVHQLDNTINDSIGILANSTPWVDSLSLSGEERNIPDSLRFGSVTLNSGAELTLHDAWMNGLTMTDSFLNIESGARVPGSFSSTRSSINIGEKGFSVTSPSALMMDSGTLRTHRLAINGSPRIENSTVNVEGDAAFNQPIMSNSEVTTDRFRANRLTVENDSTMILNEGLRIEGAGGTIIDSTLTVLGHVLVGGSIQNGLPTEGSELRINNSTVTVSGNHIDSGLNIENRSSLRVRGDLSTGESRALNLSSSKLEVAGNLSLRSGSQSTITDSTLIVQGNLSTSGPIRSGGSSIVIIGGDFIEHVSWQPLPFERVGSKFIIFGDWIGSQNGLFDYPNSTENLNIIRNITFESAMAYHHPNHNVIFFVTGDFPSDIIGGGDGSGDSGDAQITWDNVRLQNVQYVGQ